MSAAAQPLVVLLVSDAQLRAQIARIVIEGGAQAQIVETAEALWRVLDQWPALIIVELAVPDWDAPVRWARNQPHTRAIPIAAVSPDLAPEAASRARAAGCDHAWTQADLHAALPVLLDAVRHPPTRWLAGWDEAPPPALCHGIEQFNLGEYWECHETLEALWVAERRPIRDLYQGILQVGVAFHHLQRRNYAGAVKLLRRGLPRLRGLPEICQGVDVAELTAAARAVHDAVVALGPERVAAVDLAALPKIRAVGCL